MSSNGKYALFGITIGISILLTLSITVTANFYFITNIFPQIVQDEIQSILNPVNITEPAPVPTPIPIPVNILPTVNVTSPINCTINQNCILTATIDDSDGNITQAIWNQESGTQVDFTSSVDHGTTPDTYTATFKPIVNETYVFSIEAQDNNGSSVLKSITVNPKVTPTPVPVPLPSTCEPDEHLVDNICVPNTPVPTPTPTPTPTPVPQPATDMKIVITGDVASGTSGTAVFNGIAKENATNVIVLGDLGYQSDLKWFKSTYGSLNNKLNCVIGNHDSPEDGSSTLYKEAQAYCGNSYYFKKNHVLFMGFDTNGNLDVQLGSAQNLVMNTEFMKGITSVHILSHKPCFAPPNSHHPVETDIKTLCNSLAAKIPSGVKVYYDQAHNHVMSQTNDELYKQIGAGGRSHYTCPTTTWNGWCDNSHYGYLVYTIKPDGTTTSVFKDYNGKVLN